MMDEQLKEEKINAFIESLKNDDSSATMSASQLLEKIEQEGILNADDMQHLKDVEQAGNKANNIFKNSVLSNLVYTRYDDVVEYINEQKVRGITPTIDDIVGSGKLTQDASPLDVASLAYYAKTFTPVNVLPEGQFSLNNYTAIDDENSLGAERKISVSYKNGVYRADDNLAMAMTVMSEGPDGKPEVNVSFRGTDVDSRNKMVEPDGSVRTRENGMGDRYIPETYLDMAGHHKRAFSPLMNAITEVTQKVEQRQYERKGYEFAYQAGADERIPVFATGHSLGGGMAEEWTKSNSNSKIPSFESAVSNAFSSAGYLKAHGALSSLKERFEDDLNKEITGDVKLKSITFGSPSNSRNAIAEGTANLARSIKKSVVDFNTYAHALAGRDIQIEKGNANDQELQEKSISLLQYNSLMDGPLGDSLKELRQSSGLDDFGDFSKKKFAQEYEDYKKQMNDKILKQDLQVYATPNDPVAKHLIKWGFARKPGDFNVIDPLAQKDLTFSFATEGIKDREKDRPATAKVKNDSTVETPTEKKGILGTLKDFGKTVISVIAKTSYEVANAFSFNGLKSLKDTIIDRNFNIEYHSMKAYVGTTVLMHSPLRDKPDAPVQSLSDMSGVEKLAALVELKSKKDIVAMEVITKEAGIENIVREYRESLADKQSQKKAYSHENFTFKGNAWENAPGSDELTRQMTSRFQDIRNTFGNAVTLSSSSIPNVSPDIAQDMNSVAQQKLQENGLPKRFEPYEGRGAEKVANEALDFVHKKVLFAEAISDFAESIKHTDLSKVKDNPMLAPKEAHVMYVDGNTFNKTEKHSFGVAKGMETVVITPGVEPISLRRSSPGSNVWESALENKNANTISYETSAQKPMAVNIQEASISLTINREAIKSERNVVEATYGMGMKRKMT